MAKKIIAGSVSEKTICTTDFMGTLADILNVKLDDDEGVDSFSMLPLFSGIRAEMAGNLLFITPLMVVLVQKR